MSDPSPQDDHSIPIDFPEVYERARIGDREATAALVLLFNDVLRNFFACRLRKFRKLQTRHDAEDLVQEVWASVLARDPAQRTWPAPAKWKSYLLGVAGRTFFVVARGECRQKCDVRRTVHGPLPEDSSARVLAAGMPDPQQVREAEEAWLLLICRLPQAQQDIMALIRDGSTSIEAAYEAGVSERTVRRVFDRLIRSEKVNPHHAMPKIRHVS